MIEVITQLRERVEDKQTFRPRFKIEHVNTTANQTNKRKTMDTSQRLPSPSLNTFIIKILSNREVHETSTKLVNVKPNKEDPKNSTTPIKAINPLKCNSNATTRRKVKMIKNELI